MIVMKITGLERVQKTLQEFGEKVPKVAGNAVWNWSQKVAKNLRSAAPMGSTGRLKSSDKGIRAEKIGKNQYVIKAPFYLKYVEGGTGPAAGRPKYWTSKQKIKTWASGHGMNWFALKHHIHEKGTKPHPFSEEVIQASIRSLRPEVARRINNQIKRITR